MNRIEPRTLPGFMELSPNDQVKFNQMIDTIRKSYENFGFLPLDTPVIELSSVLLAKAGGETEKQIYRFNKGDNDLSLRFDLTVPLAKYVAEYYNDLSFPFKRYQIGKVYRGERMQKGRYREFYQCDIDIIGDGELNIINDAQMPAVIYNTFKKLGFDNFVIHINNRKILNGLFNSMDLNEKTVDILRIIDKIDKIREEKVKECLKDFDISDEKIDKIMEFITINGSNEEKIEKLNSLGISDGIYNQGLRELTDVVKYIKAFGVPDDFFEIDLKIARGLDYYTGTVYETFLKEHRELGSICSGGRYDNLAEFYTDKKLPGVGISIGLTRLFYQLNEINEIKVKDTSISKVIVLPMDVDMADCIEVANKLRANGINTDVYMEDGKFKKKMKYADKWQIPYSLIIGEDEVKTKMYTVKNMKTGEQRKDSIENLVKYFNGEK